MPQQQLKHETKERRLYIAVKAVGDQGNGTLEGYANVFEVKDSYGEVTRPGAFAQDIQEFISKGYLLPDHEWEITCACGFISEAKEDSKGLWFKAEFHSDDESQKIRLKVQERLAAGKEVGLSIGYWVIDGGYEMVDGEEVYMLRRLLVKEVSIVIAQANEPSSVTGVKQTREEAGVSLKTSAESYIARLREINDLGRPDSWKQERADELRSLASMLSEAADGLIPEPAAKENTDDEEAQAALALLALASMR